MENARDIEREQERVEEVGIMKSGRRVNIVNTCSMQYGNIIKKSSSCIINMGKKEADGRIL